MKDERFWPVLGAWLKDTATPAPDPRQMARQVADRLPQTPQVRRHWWLPAPRRSSLQAPGRDPATHRVSPTPAVNVSTHTVIGRTQAMFSPVKAISAVALALAIAGAFGIALPFAQRGDAPGAEADGSAMAPSFFSGTMGEYPTWIAISSPVDARRDDGVVEVSGEGYTFPWNANDPRISGTAAIIYNETDYPGGATLARTGDIGKVRTGLIRIVNDDGSWEGPYTSLQIDDLGFENSAGWLTGTGAYEGLTAYVVLLDDLTFRGHLTAEGPPPAPESLPE